MFISGPQIRAARGLLDWSVTELGAKVGIAPTTVSAIERGRIAGSKEVLTRILLAFQSGGVECTDDGGVRPRLNKVSYFIGSDGFKTFFDDVYSVVKSHTNPAVSIANADESLFQKWLGEYEAIHIARMSALQIVRYRVLLQENDTNLRSSAYSEFRWSKSDSFASTCVYIYGDKTAFIDFGNDNVTVTLVDSLSVTTALRRMFDASWNNAVPVGNNK